MPGEATHGMSRYKNKGLTSDELRRRREEGTIQLRKQKRDQQVSKRRNVEPGEMDDHADVSSRPLNDVSKVLEAGVF